MPAYADLPLRRRGRLCYGRYLNGTKVQIKHQRISFGAKGGARQNMQDVCLILGTTGVGKSRLAVSLAQALAKFPKLPTRSAEVINSDAMQVYKALPVLTAKVSEAERDGIPHRLMSFLDPIKDEYVVLDFVKDAKANVRRSNVSLALLFCVLCLRLRIRLGRLPTFTSSTSCL